MFQSASPRPNTAYVPWSSNAHHTFRRVQYLDRVFTHHMTQLQSHSLQERDLDAPRSVLEARNMLSKDLPNVEQSYSLF